MSRLVKHFVKEPKVIGKIEGLNLTKNEKNKLTEMAILLYHQKLLNRLLDYLEEEDRRVFLELLISEDEDQYLEFLHEKIVDLENIVEVAIMQIEEQLEADLAELTK